MLMGEDGESMRPGIRVFAFALLAVAVLALWFAVRPSSEEELSEASQEGESPEARAPVAAAPSDDRDMQPEPAEPEDQRAPEQPSLAAPSNAQAAHTVESDAAPLEPEVQEHARAMLVPGLAIAMDDKDLDHLRQTLDFVRQHRSENLLTDGDYSALEAAVACLEGAPEARDEARDLLGYGTRTALGKNLQRACGLR
jgi:hypothetical protein